MRNTAEAGRSLLGMLTDDELARYGEIARDQAKAELERWWLQAGLAMASLVMIAWTAVRLGVTRWWGWTGLEALGIDTQCFGRCTVIGLGLAIVLGYWPYRRVKNWTLWNEHCKAVSEEQARRRIGT